MRVIMFEEHCKIHFLLNVQILLFDRTPSPSLTSTPHSPSSSSASLQENGSSKAKRHQDFQEETKISKMQKLFVVKEWSHILSQLYCPKNTLNFIFKKILNLHPNRTPYTSILLAGVLEKCVDCYNKFFLSWDQKQLTIQQLQGLFKSIF